jgi:PAS domain S-box-containing protein
MNADGYVTDYGNQWEEITGLTRDQTFNRKFLDAVHPDDVAEFVRALKEDIAAAKSLYVEYRVRDRDGEYIWMRAQAKPVFRPDGTVLRYYGCTDNIQELKRLQGRIFELESGVMDGNSLPKPDPFGDGLQPIS